MNYLIKTLLNIPYLYIIILMCIAIFINIIYTFIYVKLYNNNNNNFTVLSNNKTTYKINILDFFHFSNQTFFGGNSNIFCNNSITRNIHVTHVIFSYIFTVFICGFITNMIIS